MSDRKAKFAFEILARENSRMLAGYLRTLVRDAAAVDDLYQETMLVAWKRLEEIDLEQPFGPWLRGVAARLVMAHYRRTQSLPAYLNEAVRNLVDREFDAIADHEGDTWHEKTTAIHDCIEHLSEKHRIAVQGRYFQALKPEALAAELGISLEACSKRLVRARRLLAECLRRKNVFSADGGSHE